MLKEYALNGGTMTTFTGENTMAAVSEKFAYWTTENVGQDTELMSAIKQAMTWQAYALANSNLANRYNSTAHIEQQATWWRIAYVALIAASAVLMVTFGALYVRSGSKNKKEA